MKREVTPVWQLQAEGRCWRLLEWSFFIVVIVFVKRRKAAKVREKYYCHFFGGMYKGEMFMVATGAVGV